jgi:hypothetical protein|tara:strand:- start:993 stop:1199 length:207 start_codon:yes stop_codon:yes gene_type:complete
MSAIKNAWVCARDGKPHLFKTEQEALDYALQIAEEWKHHSDCGSEVSKPKLFVCDAIRWLELQDRIRF